MDLSSAGPTIVRVRAPDLNPRSPVAQWPPAMIEAPVPTVGRAEMFSDVPESTLFPVEAAVVAAAAPQRRLEFAAVRYCARQALRQIGIPAAPILPDADRAPRWPAGVVGSMTHCAGYRAAVVARSDELWGIGIDAEPHGALPAAAADLILRVEERSRLRVLAEADPDLCWDRILFCAKEALFKACFPSTRRWLDFDDVSVTLHPEGTFRGHVVVSDPRLASPNGHGLTGRWSVDRGLIATASLMP
jgi:4'-phosphopantetheinyl transferase EntD